MQGSSPVPAQVPPAPIPVHLLSKPLPRLLPPVRGPERRRTWRLWLPVTPTPRRPLRVVSTLRLFLRALKRIPSMRTGRKGQERRSVHHQRAHQQCRTTRASERKERVQSQRRSALAKRHQQTACPSTHLPTRPLWRLPQRLPSRVLALPRSRQYLFRPDHQPSGTTPYSSNYGVMGAASHHQRPPCCFPFLTSTCLCRILWHRYNSTLSTAPAHRCCPHCAPVCCLPYAAHS